jgi:4-amino-4-deoxy-L-arabinose transferase-like glycosyltransferase
MGTVALRVFIYSVLPLIIAVGHLSLDKSSQSRERRLEIFLLYLFGIGVAGSGIGGFFGHYFISDSVAESIGWPTGNPFQLEVGFANLAVGILGIVAMGRRDGFREATVIAVTVLGVGATIVHARDIIETGNLAQAIPFRTSAIFSNRHCSSAFLLPAGGRSARLTPKFIHQGLTHGASPGYRPPV